MSVIDGSLAAFRAGRPGFFGDDFTQVNGVYLPLAGGTMSGAIAMGNNKITGLANGTVSTDAAAFGQLAAYLPLAGGTMSGNIAMGAHSITGLANGVATTDAAAFGQIATAIANKAQLYFTVTGTAIADGALVQYSNAGSGNITQAAGVVTITNSTNYLQCYLVHFQIFGFDSGQTVAFYLTDSTVSNVYAGVSTGVTSVANNNIMTSAVQVAANSSLTFQVVCHTSGSTFAVSTTGQGGVSMKNSLGFTQLY